MAELPETDIRVKETLRGLTSRLRFIAAKGLTSMSMLDMQSEIERTRFQFKSEHGYDFPPIGPFVLPSSNIVIFYRLDLTNDEIRDKLLMLLRELGERKVPVLTLELASAVKSLWPKYDPPVEEIRKDKRIVLN